MTRQSQYTSKDIQYYYGTFYEGIFEDIEQSKLIKIAQQSID